MQPEPISLNELFDFKYNINNNIHYPYSDLENSFMDFDANIPSILTSLKEENFIDEKNESKNKNIDIYEINENYSNNAKRETNTNSKNVKRFQTPKKKYNKNQDINILISNKTKFDYKTNRSSKFEPKYMLKKCKNILLESIYNFINQKIKILYNNDIGKGICENQLKPLNKKHISKSNALINQELINKPIRDIFSEDISTKNTNSLKEHNKKLINALITEKDIKRRKYFQNLLNLTFLQCLKHFRGEEYYVELEGMYSLEDEKEKNKGDKEYIEQINKFFLDYEFFINNLKTRTKKK